MRWSNVARVAMLSALLGVAVAGIAESGAHPGGLNREGCHHDRKNGGYHCHRAPAPASPPPRHQYTPDDDTPDASPPGRAYRNCDEARAAGAAPVRRGEPGYGPHLDRDNDGVGCEPYRGR